MNDTEGKRIQRTPLVRVEVSWVPGSIWRNKTVFSDQQLFGMVDIARGRTGSGIEFKDKIDKLMEKYSINDFLREASQIAQSTIYGGDE